MAAKAQFGCLLRLILWLVWGRFRHILGAHHFAHYGSVSYTHLDVYKRQNDGFIKGQEIISKSTLDDLTKSRIYGDDLVSVSYTHLDVYKRQF